jgi:hypothetical protein
LIFEKPIEYSSILMLILILAQLKSSREPETKSGQIKLRNNHAFSRWRKAGQLLDGDGMT